MAENQTQGKKRTPAYVPYTTFKNAIMKLDHVPDTIDYSVYAQMNGSTRTFLFGALKFFQLIDDQGEPSPEFMRLASGNEEEWKKTLKPLIERHYADQLPALKGGTPASLKKAFGDDIGASVVSPACRFLVQAAQDCGIEVSGTIQKGSFGGSPRAVRKGKERTPREGNGGIDDTPAAEIIDPTSVVFPMPLTGGREAKLIVPRDITKRDVAMLKAGMAIAEALAAANDGGVDQ